MRDKGWLVPLTGVAFIVFLIAGFVVGGEPPDSGEPIQEVVDHYVDNKDSIVAGSFLVGIGIVLMVFFANYLRHAMRASQASAAILVGAGMIAVGGAFDATLSLAMAEAADEVEPTSIQALQALWDNDFIPMAVGTVILLVSAGLSILSTGVLPRWLGWVALALALIGMTPAGFIAFLGSALWVLIASVMLAVRARRTTAPAGGPPSG